MSNKTQLSTNNTQLASLIQELQGKAAGGGGSVAPCKVTIDALVAWYSTIKYTNTEKSITTVTHTSNTALTITDVLPNSVVKINSANAMNVSVSGDAEVFDSNNLDYSYTGTFYVSCYSGDITITEQSGMEPPPG